MTYLTVHLDDGTDVDFYPDGRSQVHLTAMKVQRHALLGYVLFGGDGTVLDSRIEDGYVDVPLKPHVIRSAVLAAWRQARKARRAARQIAAATKPVTRQEPGSLEHLVLLAEGKVREDGWPRGYMVL
jgi:hypothetical protein